jgi:hypothetical protein
VAGTINPAGGRTTYTFQYGETPSYGLPKGITVLYPATAGNGTSPVTVSTKLTGLLPGMQYRIHRTRRLRPARLHPPAGGRPVAKRDETRRWLVTQALEMLRQAKTRT